ncbi:restriction endonuclease subunit S [Formosa haliotis]|uniref:restriction endonuclease subunit S n=1 Tax=Formosa haliotis TaxID=1555194 RepID=UPI0008242338|nr:restriction endonuclease subunit S [Formosa haliotis]
MEIKITKYGDFPLDWNEFRLKDIGNIITGKTPPTDNEKNFGSDYMFVTPEDLDQGKYILKTSRGLSKQGSAHSNTIKENSICVACIGYIGKIGIVKEKSFTNQQINSIEVFDDFDLDYVYYLVEYSAKRIESIAGITAVPQINKSTFGKFKFCLPSPTEQTQIANALSTVDKTIQATKNSIAKLEKLKTSLMQNLLTGKMKPDGSWRTEDEFYLDEKFGKVPKGWIVSNIGSFGQVKTGKTPPTVDEKNFSISKDIPFVTPGDVDNSVYILDTERYVTKQGLKFSNSIPKDSVCFISIGSTIGKIAITTELCCSNQQINSIIPDKDNYFLFVYYQTMFNSPRIKSIAGVTATPQINKSDLSKFKLIKPNSFNEQKLIGENLITIDDCIVKKQVSIKHFESLKKSLMQNLLTGKVRIHPQEKIKGLD